jgi:ABC-type transporter Mla subunit MlaD
MEIHSDYYTTDILDKGKESAKIDKKFNDYKLKFNSNYLEIKNSLNEIQDNIINYNSELKKLEKFLNEINEHDKNYREIIKRLNKLAEYLQETINIEKIINQLSNNQQVINMQEYISIYNRVKAINFLRNQNCMKRKII